MGLGPEKMGETLVEESYASILNIIVWHDVWGTCVRILFGGFDAAMTVRTGKGVTLVHTLTQ